MPKQKNEEVGGDEYIGDDGEIYYRKELPRIRPSKQKNVFTDDDGNTYYRKERPRIRPSIIAALIVAAASVISAFITLIPVGSKEAPLICYFFNSTLSVCSGVINPVEIQTTSPQTPIAIASSIPPTQEVAVRETITPMTTNTPTPAISPIPNGDLRFSDDFEDGIASGFSFYDGQWAVIDDDIGNKVLQSSGGSNASFGPSHFSDGIIEFRCKVINLDPQAQQTIIQLGFRNTNNIDGDWTEYILAYYLGSSPSVGLSYQEKSGTWQDVEGIYNRVEPIQNLGVDWNTFRVEAQGENIRIFVDGNLVWDAYDARIKRGSLYLGGGGVVQFDEFKVFDIGQNSL